MITNASLHFVGNKSAEEGTIISASRMALDNAMMAILDSRQPRPHRARRRRAQQVLQGLLLGGGIEDICLHVFKGKGTRIGTNRTHP